VLRLVLLPRQRDEIRVMVAQRSGWQRERKRMMRTTVEFDACYNRASSPLMEVGWDRGA
jgi:hypothetical protein